MAQSTMGIAGRSQIPFKLVTVSGLIFLIMAAFPLFFGSFQISLMSKLLLFGSLAVSLDLVWGFTGILSFAHGVFFTLGGYAMAYYLKLNLAADGNTYGIDLPDFMVWNGLEKLRWFIAPLKYFLIAMVAMVAVPAIFALSLIHI